MLRREVKAAFYSFAGPAMAANAVRHRFLQRTNGLRVHLGPGQKRYLPGWVNVDANIFTAKCDIWADLRNKLPFKDATIRALYSHHVIEHLPNLKQHFADVYRCLSHGGVYRLAGPNGDMAIRKFIERDNSWFGDWPDHRRSIGGRFENFIFCRGEHLTILTESFLKELLEDAGYVNISVCLPVKNTGYPEIFNDALETEHEDDFKSPRTLVLEAQKP